MRARALGTRDHDAVLALLAADPVVHLFVTSRVEAGMLWPGSPATLFGYPGDSPRHLLHAGANLVPVFAPASPNERAEVIAGFADALGPHRWCQSIVGESATALALFRTLAGNSRTYAEVREVRERQPLMVAHSVAISSPEAPVRPITMADFDSYFRAAVAMYTEEVGVDPLAGGGRLGYRAHCQSTVETGRAFGIVTDGQVVFKADVGISCGGIAQVQGVWLAPHLRGQQLAAPAMAAATELILQHHHTASLYVNDFNVRAIRTYERVGYETVAEFATVLY
jgi:predicted GNAT family acetyltransferase